MKLYALTKEAETVSLVVLEQMFYEALRLKDDELALHFLNVLHRRRTLEDKKRAKIIYLSEWLETNSTATTIYSRSVKLENSLTSRKLNTWQRLARDAKKIFLRLTGLEKR